ncbi:MAG: AAA family ATPase, partial [Clostridia bacterium]|nr:AAA family ATPase [Clostridia bacterium]
MMIQKIEIEQFGGLKNYELSLFPGAQYLYGANEAGKSTLCAFICAMFYGLSKTRGAGLKGDMRSLYMPWGETYMAGSLHFRAEGTDYVLQRRFGETARGDKCKLYLASDWTEVPISKDEIGIRFLGVGEDAFRKTLFISQLGAAFSKSKEDELLTRLSNLEQTGEEDASLQKAILTLEGAEHELISKTGRGGEIPKLEGEMEALRNELFEAKELNRSFRYLLEEIRTLTSGRDAGEKALADLDEQRKLAAAFEEAEKRKLAQKHITEKKERLKTEQESFDEVSRQLSALEKEQESYRNILALE